MRFFWNVYDVTMILEISVELMWFNDWTLNPGIIILSVNKNSTSDAMLI